MVDTEDLRMLWINYLQFQIEFMLAEYIRGGGEYSEISVQRT